MFSGAGGVSEEGEDHSSPISDPGRNVPKEVSEQVLSDPLGEGGGGGA